MVLPRWPFRSNVKTFVAFVITSVAIFIVTVVVFQTSHMHKYMYHRNSMFSKPYNTSGHSIFWHKKPAWASMASAAQSLSKCEFKNCRMTDDVTTDIRSHSAIIFTLTQRLDRVPPLQPSQRPGDQVWILNYLESPINVYTYTDDITNAWKNTINWTMTYRRDSDIFRPYGSLVRRTEQPTRDYGKLYDRKRKFAAWFVSACGAESGRDEYAFELRKHGIPVDVYGRCSSTGRVLEQEELYDMLNNDYKFYFAFENSLCPDYITEKLYKRYNLDIVIVVRGGANYTQLLPRGVVIDVSEFKSTRALADYLIKVNSSRRMYSDHLKAKDEYIALDQDDYEWYSYCSLCEMLNKKHEHVKVYENIADFAHHRDYSCVAPTDVRYISKKDLIELVIFLTACFVTLLYSVCRFLQTGLCFTTYRL